MSRLHEDDVRSLAKGLGYSMRYAPPWMSGVRFYKIRLFDLSHEVPREAVFDVQAKNKSDALSQAVRFLVEVEQPL